MLCLMSHFGFDAVVRELSGSPALVSFADAHLREASEGAQQALLDAVDNSDFGIRQWVASLHVLSQWLEVRGLKLDLENKIGFVSCASESAGAGSNLTHLPSLVEEMLEAYGCDRAEKA
mgnify:CR=1 FL=1